MSTSEANILAQSNQTENELYLAELGEFEDDPSADDVYVFALKMNTNILRIDTTVSKANNNSIELEMLRNKGLFNAVIHGGRLGIAPSS